MNLKKAIEFVESDDINNKYNNGSKYYDFIPANTFYVNVDSMQVMKNKVIAVSDTSRLVKSIKWTLNNQYITKEKLMVLDLIAHNDCTNCTFCLTSF